MITVRSSIGSIHFSSSLLRSRLRWLDVVISMWLFRYFAGGNANPGAIGFDRIHHHRVRADGYVVSNVDAAQNLRACAEGHVVPDLGTQSEVETQIHSLRAERNALQDGYIAADAPCSNHGSRRVREKNARSNLAARRQLQAKEQNIEIGQECWQRRDLSEPGRPARAAQHDGQKPGMQQAAEQPRDARSRNWLALEFSLACEIAVKKLR